jgi:hypothetical protein
MPASFDGITLAPVTEVYDVQAPSRAQINTYPGVNGRERLIMGTDGGSVLVKAVLYGVNPGDLQAQEAVWYGYQTSSLSFVLFDPYKGTFPAVYLELYEPTSSIGRAADGGVIREAIFHFAYLS